LEIRYSSTLYNSQNDQVSHTSNVEFSTNVYDKDFDITICSNIIQRSYNKVEKISQNLMEGVVVYIFEEVHLIVNIYF